jgi:leucyl/phenylalanyl-tRNA--protein transferase
MSTAHLASLGAREIPRARFVEAVSQLVTLAPAPAPWVADAGLMEASGYNRQTGT